MNKRIQTFLDTIDNSLKQYEEDKNKEWKKLENRIFTAKTKEEVLSVERDVDAFLNSDAPEADKEKIREVLECLLMLVEAVNGKDDKYLIEEIEIDKIAYDKMMGALMEKIEDCEEEEKKEVIESLQDLLHGYAVVLKNEHGAPKQCCHYVRR